MELKKFQLRVAVFRGVVHGLLQSGMLVVRQTAVLQRVFPPIECHVQPFRVNALCNGASFKN